ncbi:MAG: hypothetical protein QOG42_818 [Solirubrobacteraceae bacterium]|nr:hypothetical protein [Solirubrobacteraceae bacterium]
MIAHIRSRSLIAIVGLAAVCAAGVMTVGTQTALSEPYRVCSLTERQQQPANGKPTFNLTIKRKGTSCANARKVARAFHNCRTKTQYTCGKPVFGGWTCSGKKLSSTKYAIYATFTCKSGARRVNSTYQQNRR